MDREQCTTRHGPAHPVHHTRKRRLIYLHSSIRFATGGLSQSVRRSSQSTDNQTCKVQRSAMDREQCTTRHGPAHPVHHTRKRRLIYLHSSIRFATGGLSRSVILVLYEGAKPAAKPPSADRDQQWTVATMFALCSLLVASIISMSLKSY